MNTVAFIKTGDGNITLILNAKNFSVGTSHPNYQRILAALKDRKYDGLEDLLDIPTAITARMGGSKVRIENGQVFYGDLPAHNTITERILAFLSEGLPTEPLMRFFENMMANPMPLAVAELYDFLNHKGFPITEDGCFIGYKGIRQDWMDWHSGTKDNSIGKKPEMDRKEVDPNRRNECSTGLHVGTLEYASGFNSGKNGRIVLVKVNPKDCIAVPKDHDCSKLRVCTYEVLSEAQGLIETPMYPMPSTMTYSEPDGDDEDYGDDEYDNESSDSLAYTEGETAFSDGLSQDENPYDSDIDTNHEDWYYGWQDAADNYAQSGGNVKTQMPKRLACQHCGSKGGKRHATNCRRPRKS